MVKFYYNRQSIRLKDYDYSKKGMYFITICTQNREKILSKIIANKNVGADDPVRPSSTTYLNIQIQLTEIGEIIEKSWKEMSQIYENIKLGEFIIMPDHIHGIIELCEDVSVGEGGQGRPPLHRIVQGFKSVTTRQCFNYGYGKIWQRNYYEHIIRNEKEYYKICAYIQNNPQKYVENLDRDLRNSYN